MELETNGQAPYQGQNRQKKQMETAIVESFMQAWRVPEDDVLKYTADSGLASVNLNISKPSRAADAQHRSPEEIIESILDKKQWIQEILDNMREKVKKLP